jgi:DNA-binding transcriptional LysR family regulator
MRGNHLDLNLLRVLLALHETGSVSQTAERLGLSQPATSLALQRLRRALSDPLFVRTSNGMLPTSRCLQIVPGAAKALEAVNTEVLGQPPFDPAQSTREYALSINDIGEMSLLPTMVAYLARHAPFCNVRSETLDEHELDAALEAGKVDFAIGHYPSLDKAGIFKQRLFLRSFVCLVRLDHPQVQGNRISLKTFLELSHVLVRPPGRSHDLFEALLRKEGLTRRVQLLISHFMSVPAIIAHTDLIVTVPDTLAEYFARVEKLRIVQPPVKVSRYPIHQYWHERFHKDPAIQWMRQLTAELFQKGQK